jgi:hypothetical protein
MGETGGVHVAPKDCGFNEETRDISWYFRLVFGEISRFLAGK